MFGELTTFIIYILSGIVICLFFDVFRVLRKSIKTSNLITYIEDTIFWVIVGSFLIWEIFTLSYGELRSYIFIGLLLGGTIYLLTISKYFIKINVKIITFLKKLIRKIFTPIINLIRKPIYFLCINIKKSAKQSYNKYINKHIQNTNKKNNHTTNKVQLLGKLRTKKIKNKKVNNKSSLFSKFNNNKKKNIQ